MIETAKNEIEKFADKHNISYENVESFAFIMFCLERKRIYQDLLDIADKGELEELRKSIEVYFKYDKR